MFSPGDLAVMLRVSPKTITRWAREGKLASIRTPGGHRRYTRAVVLHFLHGMEMDEEAAESAVRSLV